MPNSDSRITLNLDTVLEERLQSLAALEGMSVEQFCLQALNRDIKTGDRPHAELTKLRAKLEMRKEPDSTDIIAAFRGYIDAIDLVFGDELDEYRDSELQRLLGKSQENGPEKE